MIVPIKVGKTVLTVRRFERRTGRLLSEDKYRNHITASGRDVVRDLLAGRGKPPGYIAFGTDTADVADGNTSCGSEVFRRAVSRTVPSTLSVIYESYVLATEGNETESANTYGDFCEIGLFSGTKYQTGSFASTSTRNPSLGGTLAARSIIKPIAKDSETVLTVAWEVPITCETPVIGASGRSILRNLLCNAGPAPSHMALGTHSAAVTDSDVALGDEQYRNAMTRIALEPSKVVYQMHLTTTQGNGNTYSELGVFADDREGWASAAGGLTAGTGPMFLRTTIDAFTKTADDTLTLTVEIPIQSTE